MYFLQRNLRGDKMARILVVAYNFGQENVVSVDVNKKKFYKLMSEMLQRAGNDVLCIDCVWGAKKNLPLSVKDKIIEFNPDVCLITNYGFWDLADIIDCPLWYMDIDSIENVSMATIYRMRNNISRCAFIISEPQHAQIIKEKFNATDEQIVLINLPYYEISNSSEKDMDLLYFGTNYCSEGYLFLNNFTRKNITDREYEQANTVLQQFENNPVSTSKELYNDNHFYTCNRIEINDKKTYNQILGVRKLKLLSRLCELGLTIKGAGWNGNSLNYFPEILMNSVNSRSYDFDDIHKLYDSSKVVLYLNNGPFVAGSYLRIIDALSSDTCLVAQKGGLYDDLLQSAGVPMFETAEEALNICKQLIEDDNKRNRIIKKSHKYIKANYSSSLAIQKIFNAFGIINVNNEVIGNLEVIKEKNLPVVVKKAVAPAPAKKPAAPAKPAAKKKESKFVRFLKAVLLRFGYDIDNRYSKKCYMLGPIIVYENLKIDANTNHIYICSFPIISIKKKNQKLHIRPLFFEKLVKLFIKPFKWMSKKIKQNKKTRIEKKNAQKALMAKVQIYRDLNNKLANGEKIKVCLFVSRISCWTFANLYQILQSSGKFDPIVVVKPFMFQGHDAMVEYMNITYNELKAQGYNVIKTYDEETDRFMDLRKEINPDILFYTKYWLPQFHENFYINKFRDKLTFYTSYCYDVAYHPEVMNFELNNAVNRYFMPTEIHKQMAQKVMKNHGKNVYVVGAPKLDVFFDKDYVPSEKWKNINDGKHRKRIIWAPHHSDNFPQNLYQFNAFYELTDYMFDIAKKYENEIQIAFKPHPMLKPYLYKKWGVESTDSYYQKWAELPNGQLETGEFEDLFLTSDAMILDSISFIAEYTATNKPALFTIGSKSRVNLNDFGMINFGVLYHTDRDLKQDIDEFVKNVVIEGNDYKKEEREAFVAQYMLPPNGKTSAENIYDNIMDEIKTGEKRLLNK